MSYANYHSRKVPSFISYLAGLLRYRHLCWNLVASDLRSRFRRSYLGILWAVIQPLGYSLIIAWAWGTIVKSDDYWEFAVYVYSGMLVWEYFSNCIVGSMDGLMHAVGYLRQARIPLFIFQLRVPLSGLVNMVFALAGLVILVLALSLAGAMKMPPIGVHLLLVPLQIAVLGAFMTPVAIIFSVLGTQLRDLRHIMQLALQLLFFLSPIMITREFMNSPELALLRIANPLVPLLDMLRDPLLHGSLWRESSVIAVCIWSAALWAVAFVVAVRAGRKVVFAI